MMPFGNITAKNAQSGLRFVIEVPCDKDKTLVNQQRRDATSDLAGGIRARLKHHYQLHEESYSVAGWIWILPVVVSGCPVRHYNLRFRLKTVARRWLNEREKRRYRAPPESGGRRLVAV